MTNSLITQIIIIAATLFLSFCSSNESAGTTTATENTIAGKVTDESGKSLYGTIVTLRTESFSPFNLDSATVFHDTTDAHGNYYIEWPEGTSYFSLEFTSTETETKLGFLIDTIYSDNDSTAGSNLIQNVALQKMGTLQFIPPAGADSVVVWIQGTSAVQQGVSGDTILFQNVPPGIRTIKIYSPITDTTIQITVKPDQASLIPSDSLGYSDHDSRTPLRQEILFVSVNGNDSNPGTREAPLRNIYYAAKQAMTVHASEIRVAAGEYSNGTEEGTTSIELPDGLYISGGWSPDFSERDISFITYTTTITDTITSEAATPAIRAHNITTKTIIEGLEIKGYSSHSGYGAAISIEGSSDQLIIRYNRFINNTMHSTEPGNTALAGNIGIVHSSPTLLNNTITGGTVSSSGGSKTISDLYIESSLPSVISQIAFNTFTSQTSVSATSDLHLHYNYFDTYTTVYVSSQFGADTNPGSMGSPVRTLTRAIELAKQKNAEQIMADKGEYIAKLLPLPDGIHLRGGFNSDYSRQTRHYMYRAIDSLTIKHDASSITSGLDISSNRCSLYSSSYVIHASHITHETALEGFTITGGQSCIPKDFAGGIYVLNSTDSFAIHNNIIINNVQLSDSLSSPVAANIGLLNSNPYIVGNTIRSDGCCSSGYDIHFSDIPQNTKAYILDNIISKGFDFGLHNRDQLIVENNINTMFFSITP